MDDISLKILSTKYIAYRCAGEAGSEVLDVREIMPQFTQATRNEFVYPMENLSVISTTL
jgi:hypothetical protein